MTDVPAGRTAARAVLSALGALLLLVIGGGAELGCLEALAWEPLLLDGLGSELLVGLTGAAVVVLALPRLLPAQASAPVRQPGGLGSATAASPRAGRSLVLVSGGDRGPPGAPPPTS